MYTQPIMNRGKTANYSSDAISCLKTQHLFSIKIFSVILPTKNAYKGGPYKPLMHYTEGIVCYT